MPTGTSATSLFEPGSTTPTELGETAERPPPGVAEEDERQGGRRDEGDRGGDRKRPPARARRRGSGLDEAERRASRRDELAGGLVTASGLLGERATEDAVDRLRQLGSNLARALRLLVDVRPEQRDVGCAREGRLPGQALVEDAAERVEVRPRFHVVARDLLRRDVLERADDVPGAEMPLREPVRLVSPKSAR